MTGGRFSGLPTPREKNRSGPRAGWHHAALAAGSSRRAARHRECCEARGRQAVRQTRDSGPRSQGPPRPTKQEINHLHLGGCFRNALLLLSVLHTLVNAMKPGNPRATSSAALRAASRSWGTGQRFCICRCRRSCTVRPGRGRTRNRPLARSNDNLLVAGCHFKAKIGLVHDRPPLRALRTMLITAEGRVVHQLDESYTSFLTWHPKWSNLKTLEDPHASKLQLLASMSAAGSLRLRRS